MKYIYQFNLILFPFLVMGFAYLCLMSQLYWLAGVLFLISLVAWMVSISDFEEIRNNETYLKYLDHFDGEHKPSKKVSHAVIDKILKSIEKDNI